MAESIEQRLRREDDTQEIKSYNEFVNKINELIPKIVKQFDIKVPKGHQWVDNIMDHGSKAAWGLGYLDPKTKFGGAWITTEGYLLLYGFRGNGRESIALIKGLKEKSRVTEEILITTSNSFPIWIGPVKSKYLSEIFTQLEEMYDRNSKMIEKEQKNVSLIDLQKPNQ